MSIKFHHYGLDAENIKAINALAVRVRTIDSTVSATPFGKLRGTNKWSAAAVDKMVAAVATADGLKPNFIYGRQWHTGRDVCSELIALEARVTALGK
jgi:hypothetical protein